ncbi:hypothetical protein BRD03_10405 [Halobacteriales archaeon QS_9_68_17]|nr:MAG: hypothetical protein BRD03_10405 [Halobacteriales archaeon QS_9_68_17]
MRHQAVPDGGEELPRVVRDCGPPRDVRHVLADLASPLKPVAEARRRPEDQRTGRSIDRTTVIRVNRPATAPLPKTVPAKLFGPTAMTSARPAGEPDDAEQRRRPEDPPMKVEKHAPSESSPRRRSLRPKSRSENAQVRKGRDEGAP